MVEYNIHINHLLDEDINEIIKIVEALPEWFNRDAIKEIRRDAKNMIGYVARIADTIKGFILLDERECCIEIAWLAVERSFHGRGIGSLLVKTAEDYACKRGKPVLTVKTYGGMDYQPYIKTLQFYMNKGFRLYEIINNYQPFSGQPAAILVKVLKC